MMLYFGEHEKEWLATHDFAVTKEILPDMVLFENWLEQNKDKFQKYH